MNNSKLVYSTNDSVPVDTQSNDSQHMEPRQQRVRLHLDRKGGGKIITLIKGLKETNDALNSLAKSLKKACGGGGAVKDGNILIQGNHREKIQLILSEKGYDVKLSGG
jgi:translation initiation factor 1